VNRKPSTVNHRRPEVLPKDRHNNELVDNVHPADWVNPEPVGRYHLVVIGAGTAGLVTAAGAAILGARVALIERHLMGGDCLNVGCVPSKALLSSARTAATILRAGRKGVQAARPEVDFPAVMKRLRRLRARISHHDSVERFRKLGVDVFLGSGRFAGGDRIEVDGKTLRFKKAVIATGGSPSVPPIEGLEQTGYLTNETVFNLTEIPRRMMVLGGGPIGCELAQAFCRLGCDVTLVEAMRRLLPREDPEAAEIIAESLLRDGVRIRTGARALRFETEGGSKLAWLEHDDPPSSGLIQRDSLPGRGQGYERVEADEMLIAVGRRVNVTDLNLEGVGVEFDSRKGVTVNDRLRTSNRRIFAAGDVCLPYQFTHAADAAARIVLQNSLFPGNKRFSAVHVPWCTYTDPEVAQVGLSPEQAAERDIEVDTFRVEMSDVDRAIVEGEDEGFVKVRVARGSDRIVGATIVARNAGDLIGQLSMAMAGGLGLGAISRTVFPYPTRAEAIRKVADAHARTRLTPIVQKLIAFWLRLTG
jgi:pyruvate/2-oxoglutarate dehydrogenase complex dihydrolipoamide dehydrogenase (E3) component